MSVKESKSTQELLARIRDLEIENMELKSKLDQYQSVFPATGGPPIAPGASPKPGPKIVQKLASFLILLPPNLLFINKD